MFLTPIADHLLIEPVYDPDKIGSIYMPPAAQNDAPSHGIVRFVGPQQKEVEVGWHVLLSTAEWVKKASMYWHQGDTRLYFYTDREVIAFVTEEAETFPRRNRLLVRPSWEKSGVVEHKTIVLINRVFDTPQPPQTGVVLKVGEDCKTFKRGDVIVIPKWGGNELAVKDRVLYSLLEKDIPARVINAVDNGPVKTNRHRATSKRGSR